MLPRNDKLCATHLVMPHEVLMGTKADVDNIVEAFAKVQRNSAKLAGTARSRSSYWVSSGVKPLVTGRSICLILGVDPTDNRYGKVCHGAD